METIFSCKIKNKQPEKPEWVNRDPISFSNLRRLITMFKTSVTSYLWGKILNTTSQIFETEPFNSKVSPWYKLEPEFFLKNESHEIERRITWKFYIVYKMNCYQFFIVKREDQHQLWILFTQKRQNKKNLEVMGRK